MITGNYYEDNPDLQFTMEHCIDWETIIPLHENGFADAKHYEQTGDEDFSLAPKGTTEALESYRLIMHQVGEIAGKEVAPVAAKMEAEGLRLENGRVRFPADFMRLFDIVAEAGILAFPVKRKYGGLHMPFCCTMFMRELLTRGDNSFEISVAVTMLTAIVQRFCAEDAKEKFLPALIQGKMCCAMALTEPDHGSDLTHVRTRAIRQEDGSYRITGTKRFITHGCGVGDRPALLFVLARTADGGARGLSFFTADSSDVTVSRIEHKLGLTCSPTCELVFDNTPARLVGREGEGLVKHVMAMLNAGRLGVAVESVGVSQGAFEEARKYASERTQFGVPIREFPAVARMLGEMEAIVQANRALTCRSMEVAELSQLLANRKLEEGLSERAIRKDAQIVKLDRLAKLFTSVAKIQGPEYANRVAYDALQVFGGVGFTEEFDIARIYRDARIATIYEGTTQIHVNAAIAVLTEGLKKTGLVSRYLREEIVKIKSDERKAFLSKRCDELEDLVATTRAWERRAKDHVARDITEFFGHLFTLTLLAWQCDVAREKSSAEFAEAKERVFGVFLTISEKAFAATRLEIAAVGKG